MSSWTQADVPDQRGRTVVITGANTGIGFEAAKVLAERGATVVLACRDAGKAARAAARIGGDVSPLPLDLASLTSVRRAAERLRATYPRIDVLINNAGVMMPPYGHTEDGFELQFGTNHLGHFALTGLLLDRLLATPDSRVVTVSSNGHRRGRINFDDLQSERGYRRMDAYAQSKLANLMFTYELQCRLAAAGARTIAVAAHPGGSRTDLMRHSPLPVRVASSRRLRFVFSRWLIQDADLGALPTLRAATDPAVGGGEYYGPDGWHEWTGFPARVRSSDSSRDADAQRRLWERSEQLTGVPYPVTPASLSP